MDAAKFRLLAIHSLTPPIFSIYISDCKVQQSQGPTVPGFNSPKVQQFRAQQSQGPTVPGSNSPRVQQSQNIKNPENWFSTGNYDHAVKNLTQMAPPVSQIMILYCPVKNQCDATKFNFFLINLLNGQPWSWRQKGCHLGEIFDVMIMVARWKFHFRKSFD